MSMNIIESNSKIGHKVERVFDSLESLAIVSGGGAMAGFAVAGILGQTTIFGVVVGALGGVIFWCFHPYAD